MPDGQADRYCRHDLVRVEPSVWAAWLGTHGDLAGLPHLSGWAEAGRPLVVRRPAPGEAGDGVPLGLPLPPALGKRRIGLALPVASLIPMAAPGLVDAAVHAPTAWRPTLDALAALGMRHGVSPRPFGGLLWQAVTGLAYLGPASDLDLLWSCRGRAPAGLLDGIAALASVAPMRIDGEILLPDGAGVHWRELRDTPEGRSVLAKRMDGLALRPVAHLRTTAPRLTGAA